LSPRDESPFFVELQSVALQALPARSRESLQSVALQALSARSRESLQSVALQALSARSRESLQSVALQALRLHAEFACWRKYCCTTETSVLVLAADSVQS